MVGRHELTDAAWARIEPLLPATGRRGGRWRDHRQVINAILWQAKTGVPWRDLPERYGPWKTAHERLRRWTADGTWERILEHVVVKDDAVGAIEWTISVDSSSVRAHKHAAGARKKGAAVSRSRPSLSTARRSGAPVAASAARSTWSTTAGACRWGCGAHPGRPETTPRCCRCLMPSGCRPRARGGRASGPIISSPTGLTPIPPPAGHCAAAASGDVPLSGGSRPHRAGQPCGDYDAARAGCAASSTGAGRL